MFNYSISLTTARISFCASLFILATVGCNNDAEKTKLALKDPPNSNSSFCTIDSLERAKFNYGDLHDPNSVFSYDLDDLNQGKTNFSNNFHYKDKLTQLGNPEQRISVGELGNLIDTLNKDFSDAGSPILDKDYRALKMNYGIDNAGNMIIVFKPMVLRFKDSTTDLFKIEDGKRYFIISNGKLTQENNFKKIKNLIDAYQSNDDNIGMVYINHITVELGDQFNDDSDFVLGDTKYSIMSFKQIYNMYRANKDSSCNDNDLITFKIVASNYYVGVENYKLHVIAYFKMPIKDFPRSKSTGYDGLGADFTQMGPPNNSESPLPVTIESTKNQLPQNKNKH